MSIFKNFDLIIKEYKGQIFCDNWSFFGDNSNLPAYDFNIDQPDESIDWRSPTGENFEIEIEGEQCKVIPYGKHTSNPLSMCLIEGIGPGGMSMWGTVAGIEDYPTKMGPNWIHRLQCVYSEDGSRIYSARYDSDPESPKWSRWNFTDGVSRTETANGLDLKLIDRKLTGQAGTSGMCTLTVYNQSGATVAKLTGNASISYDTQQLAPGVYIAVIDNGNGGTRRLKFIR